MNAISPARRASSRASLEDILHEQDRWSHRRAISAYLGFSLAVWALAYAVWVAL
jgi:hypothetical protein